MGNAVDLGQAAVEILEVGDHDLIPHVELLQVADQVLVGYGEFTRQVGFHIQVLVGRLDRGRDADNIRDGCGRGDREAIGVAHAELADAATQWLPVQGRRTVDFDVAAALFDQELDRILRQDALGPQRAFISRVTATLFSQLGGGPVGVISHCLHRTVGEFHRLPRPIGHAHFVQAILEAHDAQADRSMLEIGVASLVDGVIVDVDHVVEHAHGGRHRVLQLFLVELAILDMGNQVYRAQIADRNLAFRGIERDLGAKVGAVNHAHMLLRAADVAGVLEGDPGMPGLEQHRQHLAPDGQRRNTLEQLQFAGFRAPLVLDIGCFELLADLVVQVRRIGGRKQRPFPRFHDPLHEEVRNPVGRVHVMRAAAIIAGVLAQLEKLLDVQMPGLQVGAHRSLALAALVHRHRGVVHDLEKRNNALRFAVRPLDMGAERAHRRPVVAEPAGELRQQRVFLDGVVDAFQVVRHRGQVAARQLGTLGAGIEQGGRRGHEIEARQHVVKLDGSGLALDFVDRQPHRHAHEKGLRQFDAPVAHMQEVTVIQGLQAKVAELEIAMRIQRRT